MSFKYSNSEILLRQAYTMIPGLTQTFSKGPQVYGFLGSPHFISRGSGVVVNDVDGNTYIDYSMGLGSVILGHADKRVNKAIYKSLTNGNSHSLMHPLELKVAEKVIEICPWADMVRFGKNGSDVTTAAVRLARALTGRNYIAIASEYGIGSPYPYHGWHDWSACYSDKALGIPIPIKNLTLCFKYNNATSLKKLFEQYPQKIAAIILEGTKFEPPTPEFIRALNLLSKKYNAILIIDEIANGLRLSPGGAHQCFGIEADIVAFGKAFGNGIPISILVGKADYMKQLDNVMFTLSYGGETLGLAAIMEVLKIYFAEAVENDLENKGNKLISLLQEVCKELQISNHIAIKGYPSRFIIQIISEEGCIDKSKNAKLIQLLLQNGIICSGVHNISQALNMMHIENTVNIYKKVFKEVFYENIF